MLRTWGELSLDEFFEIARVRTEVFFLEQRIDEEELDERDREETTEHVWISDDRGVAAYLRVVVDEQPQEGNRDARRLIGRVVTRADCRGQGLARRLIEHVIERHGHEPLALHSQSYIQPLYAALGFEPYGDEYVEAGIPHVSMYRAATA
ncbi:MAG: GNAT family N-acetyltransferase [Leifsonia sp.]|jgi:ElaA protein|uniref:GNAT family N-acetyltransferase n=2 Tax=Microcella pacifica TaxID=2591847 RepID=A0A9E5MIE3_9MICO|nr:GNAT family N-acetyltransferase [Leifsonia sp.]NHF63590.1 GNAT family N-acetyltransferase [Microcella pacifica]